MSYIALLRHEMNQFVLFKINDKSIDDKYGYLKKVILFPIINNVS
jgi:hypothetical protein